MTTPAAGLIAGVAVLSLNSSGKSRTGGVRGSNRSASSSSTRSNSTTADISLNPSFLGPAQSFRFGPEGGAVKQNLGECVTAADLTGMEVRVGDDLLIPPVRPLNDVGLPQLWPKETLGERFAWRQLRSWSLPRCRKFNWHDLCHYCANA